MNGPTSVDFDSTLRYCFRGARVGAGGAVELARDVLVIVEADKEMASICSIKCSAKKHVCY